MSAAGLAFTAAAALAVSSFDLAGGVTSRAPRFGAVQSALNVLSRAGSEGVDPGVAERRRLLGVGSVVAFASVWFTFGFVAGCVAACAAPSVAGRVLRSRRERYRAAVDAGAAEIAVALADALSGGHSLRGALMAAAASVTGAPGRELRRLGEELELGVGTDEALEAMRRRVGSSAVDVIVAGALMQRRAGGDLAQLLRSSARAFEDEARLLGEVKAATAQARFTGMVVVLLPLGGAALTELASPGFARGLVTNPLSATLVGMAVVMQIGAAFAIRKLARLSV
ncbi:MAG: tight adherence protein [Thermoleophilaceae bacterium]|jgi:tight adherence protein B|nr:tight adherence protein [Thermoleophilaceae bacterium]